ncbi:hypothetical protein M5D96_013981 [Drosophila gunungcola]|uniref:Uncharacterized protein n=1 Tax=Drosophila gunungcola TaxID=103775 RepID=A0A9P9YAC6_9MUSC|nr:hypothetical protein M5D96_013981 [Drosophila gunungcola]
MSDVRHQPSTATASHVRKRGTRTGNRFTLQNERRRNRKTEQREHEWKQERRNVGFAEKNVRMRNCFLAVTPASSAASTASAGAAAAETKRRRPAALAAQKRSDCQAKRMA